MLRCVAEKSGDGRIAECERASSQPQSRPGGASLNPRHDNVMRAFERQRWIPEPADAGQTHAGAIDEIGARAEIDIAASKHLHYAAATCLDIAGQGFGSHRNTTRAKNHRVQRFVDNQVACRQIRPKHAQRGILVERDQVATGGNQRDVGRCRMLQVKCYVRYIARSHGTNPLRGEKGHIGQVSTRGVKADRVWVRRVDGRSGVQGGLDCRRAVNTLVRSRLEKKQ